ncbi:FliH/SctL family protein [Pseudodonghicola xiamenensis]|uniref:FliH/SctL family protein n=1 Tax=Pseudodonghicola xiamenensis TaxID=337702 RepID=UPI000A065109|nr:FliH/SctL family protein [Pseudodonghicola xiamenensis]
MRLLLRDFDAEDARVAEGGQAPVEPEPIRSLPLDEVDRLLVEARELAFAQGREQGADEVRTMLEQARETRVAATLEVLCSQVEVLLSQEDRRRREMERDMVGLALDIAERVAPEFLSAYGRGLTEERVREGVRMAQGSARLRLRLSPQMTEAMEADIADLLAPAGPVPDVRADPALADGEARLDWDGGGLSYSLDALCDTVLAALREAAAKLKDDQEKVG